MQIKFYSNFIDKIRTFKTTFFYLVTTFKEFVDIKDITLYMLRILTAYPNFEDKIYLKLFFNI